MKSTRTPFLVSLFGFSAALLSTGPAMAFPFYCPGAPTPCGAVCECPSGVPQCGEDDPPPCCLGGQGAPCAIAYNPSNDLSSFSDLIYSDNSCSLSETLTLASPTSAVAVVSMFGAGQVLNQQVIELSNPNQLYSVDLSRLSPGADSFRVNIASELDPTADVPQAPGPSVYHVATPSAGSVSLEDQALAMALGVWKRIVRLFEEPTVSVPAATEGSASSK